MRPVERSREYTGRTVIVWNDFKGEKGPRRDSSHGRGPQLYSCKAQEGMGSPIGCSLLEKLIASLGHDEVVHVCLLLMEVDKEVVMGGALKDQRPWMIFFECILKDAGAVQMDGLLIWAHRIAVQQHALIFKKVRVAR